MRLGCVANVWSLRVEFKGCVFTGDKFTCRNERYVSLARTVSNVTTFDSEMKHTERSVPIGTRMNKNSFGENPTRKNDTPFGSVSGKKEAFGVDGVF